MKTSHPTSNPKYEITTYLLACSLFILLDSYLSSEQDGCVIVFWVTITNRVVLLLPLAEVPQGKSSIIGDIWSLVFVMYHHKFYHR